MHIGKRVLSTAAVAVAMTAALVGAGLAQDATPTAMDQHDVSAPFPTWERARISTPRRTFPSPICCFRNGPWP